MTSEDLFFVVARQFRELSPVEVVAVVLAVAYLVLAIRQHIACWLCAFFSASIYVVLFVSAKLYMEALLNVFYAAMAVYGWWSWRGGDAVETLPVTRWTLRTHTGALAGIVALAVVAGALLTRYTDAAYPYVDSATTFAALWATFLVARKVLENWWYWLVIDVVSVAIYWQRGLELTSLLFILYIAMIPFGLIEWTRSYRRREALVAA